MSVADNIHLTDPVFETLPRALVHGLALSQSQPALFKRGQSIFSQTRSQTFLYLMSEGWAASSLRVGTGDRQILDILGPGSLAGLTGRSPAGQAGFSITALQDIKTYPISMDRLRTLCAQNDAVFQWLNAVRARHADRMQRHLIALGQLSARARLAFAMLRIVDVARQSGRPATGETIHLPMTQEEIGNMLGLTNVSVSKLMSAFRQEKLIDYGRNRIIVHDVDALSEICGMTLEACPVTQARHDETP